MFSSSQKTEQTSGIPEETMGLPMAKVKVQTGQGILTEVALPQLLEGRQVDRSEPTVRRTFHPTAQF